MIWLANGDRVLYQWTRGAVVLLDTRCGIVRLSREDDQRTQDAYPVQTGGIYRAVIPDRMLRESGYLRVSCIVIDADGERVADTQRFIIRAAQRPTDYVHGAQETASWAALDMRMDALERAAREGRFNGAKGDPGDDYVLTEEDKQEIRDAVLDELGDLPSGGTGLPEVYVGAEAPEDGAMLWVDTDDDSVDNVLGVSGAAVGQVVRIEAVDEDGVPTKWSAVEPSEVEGVYELIDTITITDGVTSIDISTEPDGTPYRFEHVFLKLKTQENVPAASGWSFWDQTGAEIMYHYHAAGTANQRSGMEVWKANGYWNGAVYTWRSVHTTYGMTYFAGDDKSLTVQTAGSYISRITTDGVAVGMTIEVWGVRPRG